MSDDGIQPITLSLDDRAKTEADAVPIVCRHRPEWAGRPLKFKFFTAGITNQVLSVWPADSADDRDRLIIRIHGNNTERIIDRSVELRTWRRLAAAGCASQLYGRFSNGVVYEYKPGKPLDVQSVRQPHMCKLVAEAMVRLHSIGRRQEQEPATEPPAKDWMWTKIRLFIDRLPDRFEDAEKQKRYAAEFPPKSQLLVELAAIRADVESLGSETVMCHNDLLLNNIIYDQPTDQIHFIDYEYAAFNHQAYDIANHFVEYAGVDDCDFGRYPAADDQRQWLGYYLTAWHDANNMAAPCPADIQRLFVQATHFFWCAWSVLQAHYSQIDFDYLGYGIERYEEYKKTRARFASLQL